MLQRILRTSRAVLDHRFLPPALAAIAVLLTAGSLRIGWMFDDEIHRAAFSTPTEIAELERPFWDLFAFLGDRWRPQSDFLPWWANESITVAFFRPVTGWTHWLDHQLWPTRAMAMHLHNLLWFAAVVTYLAVMVGETRVYASTMRRLALGRGPDSDPVSGGSDPVCGFGRF